MNKKALFTGVITLLVMFAVLPAANAVVLDPSSCPAGNSTAVKNMYAQYNSTPKTCMYGLVTDSLLKKYKSITVARNVLKNKPVSNLTWNEAYYMAQFYSSPAIGKPYSIFLYNKDVNYANQMINVQNTPQSRALAYLVMENAAGSMYKKTFNNQWDLKQSYFTTMLLQNDPSGIVNGGGSDWNNSTWWDSLGLENLKEEGYNVPQKAISLSWAFWTAASNGKLKTQAQLKEIGFFQWKKNYLIPIINEKAPQKSIPTKIVDTLPGVFTFILKYGRDLVKAIGGIFLLGIVLLW